MPLTTEEKTYFAKCLQAIMAKPIFTALLQADKIGLNDVQLKLLGDQYSSIQQLKNDFSRIIATFTEERGPFPLILPELQRTVDKMFSRYPSMENWKRQVNMLHGRLGGLLASQPQWTKDIIEYDHPLTNLAPGTCVSLLTIGEYWRDMIRNQLVPRAGQPQLRTPEDLIDESIGGGGPLPPQRPAAVEARVSINAGFQKGQYAKNNKEERVANQNMVNMASAALFAVTNGKYGLKPGGPAYDPIISKKGGQPKEYAEIIPSLAYDANNNGTMILQFVSGQRNLDHLPGNVAELCVIACVAEVGRGYAPNWLQAFAWQIQRFGARACNMKMFLGIFPGGHKGDGDPSYSG